MSGSINKFIYQSFQIKTMATNKKQSCPIDYTEMKYYSTYCGEFGRFKDVFFCKTCGLEWYSRNAKQKDINKVAEEHIKDIMSQESKDYLDKLKEEVKSIEGKRNTITSNKDNSLVKKVLENMKKENS